MIRKAELKDIEAIASIYENIITLEEAGKYTTCWVRGVYPTEKTALNALSEGTLYVMEEDGIVVGSAIINQKPADGYERAKWKISATMEESLVIHTLAISPKATHKGYGEAFIRFYEDMGKERGLKALRLDTNEKNIKSRPFYKSLGYTEVDIVKSNFNGVGIVNLVCIEKEI